MDNSIAVAMELCEGLAQRKIATVRAYVSSGFQNRRGYEANGWRDTPRAVHLFFGWKVPAMKSETPLHRYRREAAECELNAEKATNRADQEQRLTEDWTKLARGAAVNPRLGVLEWPARAIIALRNMTGSPY
jgi:hypothetical protein